MNRQYETTIVIDAHLPAEHVDTTITKYTKLIEDNKGKVNLVDRWGKRRLAYEINKKQYGYYIYLRFECEGSFIKELEREYKLDDAILRYLTVLVPKALLKKEQDRASKIKTDEKEPEPSPSAAALSETDADKEADSSGVNPTQDDKAMDTEENIKEADDES